MPETIPVIVHSSGIESGVAAECGLLGDLCLCAVTAVTKYLEAYTDTQLMPGIIAFSTMYEVTDKIIDDLQIPFKLTRPPQVKKHTPMKSVDI